MSEPRWLSEQQVIRIHDQQLAIHGGPPGLRNAGLLGSAVARPCHTWAHGVEDLADLAAAYAFGLSANHPFVDGNKRTALVTLVTFLRLNRVPFHADEYEAAAAMIALAAGEIEEEGLARWIRDRWPRPDGARA